MSEKVFQNVFVNGKMDSDTDYSLIDNKSYVWCKNLRISGNGNDGAFHFIKGSKVVSDYYASGNMVVLGGYHNINNSIFYFLANKEGLSKIIRYDIETEQTQLIIQDSEVLRFDLVRWHEGEEIKPYRYILSINQVGNLLIFSHEVWEDVRVVNLDRLNDYANGFSFDDISLNKKPPKLAPLITTSRDIEVQDKERSNMFVSFAYRYKYKDGYYSSLSFYSDVAFETGFQFKVDKNGFTQGDNFSTNAPFIHGMNNRINKAHIKVDSGDNNVTDIEVYARERGSNTAYLVYKINKEKSNIDNNVIIDNIEYDFSKNYTVLNEQDTNMLYSNIPKFPKTQDVAGNRLFFGNYKEGYDLKDKEGDDIIIDYELKNKQDIIKPFSFRKTAISLFEYKVGVVFFDDYNISSTTLLPLQQQKSELFIPFADRLKENHLIVETDTEINAPYWATKMKFVVKSKTLNYQNLYITYAKRIGNELYLYLRRDNIERVKKGDVLIRVDKDTERYNEYNVLEVKEYTIEDGLSRKGVYAKIEIDTDFYFETNGTFDSVSREYETNRGIIDNHLGYKDNPDRFIASDEINPTGNYTLEHGRKWNHCFLKKSDFGEIKEGDTLTLRFKMGYQIYDTKSLGGGKVRDSFKPITFNVQMYASADYPNIKSFLDDEFDSPYFAISNLSDDEELSNLYELIYAVNYNSQINTEDYILFKTNTNYPSYVESNNTELWNFEPHEDDTTFGVGDYVLAGVHTLNSVLERGIKPLMFRTKNKDEIQDIYHETSKTYPIVNGKVQADNTENGKSIYNIGFYNGYCWNNGVESYKIKDAFLGKSLGKSFRGNLHAINEYKRMHRKYDVTYSGIYNYDLGINNLNTFNPTEVNWINLPIRYGEIQRIISSDNGFSVFMEDKIIELYYGKSIIMDMQGNENVGLSNQVLGGYQEFPYEFGIGKNPESAVKYSDMIFFVDPKRHRFLVKAGKKIKEINAFQSGFYNEGVNLIKKHHTFLGAFDENNSEYVVSFDNDYCVSFNSNTQGFSHYTTYKSDFILGANAIFFAGYKGVIYQNENTSNYNDFVGQGNQEAGLKFVVNAEMNLDKHYNTIQLYSNSAWNVKARTNLTETYIPQSAFEQQESYFYSEIFKDYRSNKSIIGIGNIVRKEGNWLFFDYPINDEVYIDCILINDENHQSSKIVDLTSQKIKVDNPSLYNVGNYVYANVPTSILYRPDGEPMLGQWIEYTLTLKGNKDYYLTSAFTKYTEREI